MLAGFWAHESCRLRNLLFNEASGLERPNITRFTRHWSLLTKPAISFQHLRLYPPTSCGQNLPWRPKRCVKESSSWRTAALTPFQMVNSGVLSAMHALQTSLLTSSAISSEGSAMPSSVELNTWPVQRTFKEASPCMQQACVPEWSDNRLNRWHLLCAIKDSEDNGKQEWKEPGAGQLKMGLYKGRKGTCRGQLSHGRGSNLDPQRTFREVLLPYHSWIIAK